MSLPKKLAAIAAPIAAVAFLLAGPVSAQTLTSKAEPNSTTAAAAKSMVTSRPSTTEHKAGAVSNAVQASRAANDVK